MSSKFGCSLFQAALLELRGVSCDDSFSVVNSWLNPDMESMIAGLDLGASSNAAVNMIKNLDSSSDVLVYGDYDVDGISSTTLAMEIVMAKRANVRYFIPHRFNQGYGLHLDMAHIIAKRKCDLVIVVDCGSQDAEAVKKIKDSGIPVIIFDHHLVAGTPAVCDTMVNPQISGDVLAKRLCATGVLWCWAWQNDILSKEHLLRLLDVVALATVADCVSLASPLNRVLVREGLDVMRRTPRAGLLALMEKLGIASRQLEVDDLSMKIIPCLNAAGRLYLADVAVKILFAGSDLIECVDKIISLNRKRRELSTKILSQVDSAMDEGFQYVLTNKDWSVGVLSSVASRICNERNAPVALVASAGSTMRGTLRMPSGGDAVGVLKALSPMLHTWGGHRLAAGFSVKTESWDALRVEMESLLSKVTVLGDKEDLLSWAPADLDIKTWKDSEALGPFGMENPAPKLYCPNEGDVLVSPLGRDGKHVKVSVGGASFLGFGAAGIIDSRSDLCGWVYKPRIDTWQNVARLQFVLEKMVTE